VRSGQGKVRATWLEWACGISSETGSSGSVCRHPDCCSEGESVTKWRKMSADGGEFCLRGAGRIHDRGRRTVALKTAFKDFCGRSRAQTGGVEENCLRVPREVASTGELCDRHAGKGKVAQSAFGAVEEKAVAIADANETGEAMFFFESRRAHEHFEFSGTFADGVARRPSSRAQHRHAGRRGGEGVRQSCGEGKPSKQTPQRVRYVSDWHRIEKSSRCACPRTNGGH
jgi:hypothetical protein